MGSWIYHLRIAEKLLDRWSYLDTLGFTYGSLAPDSGRPSADWSSFDPPKELTHFLQPKPLRPRSADLIFYREYLAPRQEIRSVRYAFTLGYLCHLLADNLWIVQIEPGSREGNPALFARLGEGAWDIIKQDWYDLDRRHLASHPECLFWRFSYEIPKYPRFLPFLDWDSLYEQYDYMRRYYLAPSDNSLERPYPYLNQATMDRCVADSTRKIGYLVDFLASGVDTARESSAIALLPTEDLLAYPAPLGDVG